MKAGDVVSVFSDLEGRCTRGATSFQGKRAFVGNGVAQMDRSRIFCSDEPVKYDDKFFMLLDNMHSRKFYRFCTHQIPIKVGLLCLYLNI